MKRCSKDVSRMFSLVLQKLLKGVIGVQWGIMEFGLPPNLRKQRSVEYMQMIFFVWIISNLRSEYLDSIFLLDPPQHTNDL